MKNFITAAVSIAALAAATSSFALTRPDLVGAAVSPDSNMRTVSISPDTKRVRVLAGETVRFENKGKYFAVRFYNSSTPGAVDLNAVAPAALDHQVIVSVESNRQTP